MHRGMFSIAAWHLGPGLPVTDHYAALHSRTGTGLPLAVHCKGRLLLSALVGQTNRYHKLSSKLARQA